MSKQKKRPKKRPPPRKPRTVFYQLFSLGAKAIFVWFGCYFLVELRFSSGAPVPPELYMTLLLCGEWLVAFTVAMGVLMSIRREGFWVKNERISQWVYRAVLTGLFVWLSIFCVLPKLRDLPVIMSANYAQVTGKVVKIEIIPSMQSYRVHERKQVVYFEDEKTHKTLKITFRGNNFMANDDTTRIEYLPVTH